MENTAVGSGVMIALAAALWLVYLVPSWLRSREFSATERNAVRLQQTLRVLAETAEVPTTVRAETTARSVAQHEAALRRQEAQRAAAAKALTVATPAQRVRRSRAVTSVILLASLVTVVVAAFAQAFLVVAFAVIMAVSAVAMLSRLASVTRSRAVVPVQAPVARRVTTTSRTTDAAPARQAQWTPVPIPKPLYLSRDTVQAAPAPSQQLAAQLRAAALQSEQAVRAAHSEPEVAPMPSRFAAMGVVDESQLGSTNIDEVLQRRRSVG